MKIILSIILIIIITLFYSCESDLDKVNENKNDPSKVSPALLLTEISRTTFQVGGKNQLYASRMIISTSRDDVYQFFKWNQGSYDPYKTLLQVTKMIEEAASSNNNNYIAIAKFFRAYHFYNLTMTFGDIPYTDALKGESEQNFNPKYDKQEDVFIGILTELEEANRMISSNSTISGDIIYNGNVNKWKKLINVLRLRILLTLSGKSSINNINIANQFSSIVETENLMTSIDDNAQLIFLDRINNRYSSFNDSDYGSSLYMSSSFIDIMKERKDPRLFTFAERTGKASSEGLLINDFNAYNGGNPIIPYSENEKLVQEQNISKVNQRFYKNPINEPHILLSYTEQEFILAEASLRGWISSDPKQHYENAIVSSFDFYQKYLIDASIYFEGFDIKNYLNQDLVAFDKDNSFEAKLDLIMTQKYITTFHQEGWLFFFDYLRTNYPQLPIQQGTSKPYRFLYPTSEYNNNTKNLEEAINRQFNGIDDIKQKTWLYN